MKFEIVKNTINDANMNSLIIKMFEYFISINQERTEKAKKSKNKEDFQNLMTDLLNYVEIGLQKKYSENFNVLINKHPNYALKYEKNTLLGLKSDKQDIIIFKPPYIAIRGQFKKENYTEEENVLYESFQKDK
jgi:hypothetical protein